MLVTFFNPKLDKRVKKKLLVMETVSPHKSQEMYGGKMKITL